MQNKIKPEHLVPSGTTFPVQDKFNQVHMFTGLTKLEYMVGQISANSNVTLISDESFLNDLADSYIEFATILLTKCNPIQEPESKIKPI
jgi:hypothetical protein